LSYSVPKSSRTSGTPKPAATALASIDLPQPCTAQQQHAPWQDPACNAAFRRASTPTNTFAPLLAPSALKRDAPATSSMRARRIRNADDRCG
jgi:hypothetical protein